MLKTDAESFRQGGAELVSVSIVDPEAPLPTAEVDRLFGPDLSAARRRCLLAFPRIVAACGPRIVGLAAYEHLTGEVRVYEFGIDPRGPCRIPEVAGVVLDALELACLACGAHRLVLTARAATAGPVLWKRGYSKIGGGSHDGCLQKNLR